MEEGLLSVSRPSSLELSGQVINPWLAGERGVGSFALSDKDYCNNDGNVTHTGRSTKAYGQRQGCCFNAHTFGFVLARAAKRVYADSAWRPSAPNTWQANTRHVIRSCGVQGGLCLGPGGRGVPAWRSGGGSWTTTCTGFHKVVPACRRLGQKMQWRCLRELI